MANYEYEKTLADLNYKAFGMETFFLYSKPELSMVNSAMVRELLRHGKDVSSYVPAALLPLLDL